MPRKLDILTLTRGFTILAMGVALTSVSASDLPPIMVLSSSEDASGTTQDDLTMPMLAWIERRTVEQVKAKSQAYLNAHGQNVQLPKLNSEAHYVTVGKTKLAVVRVTAPQIANIVFIHGLRAAEFHRVACVRTRNIDESIPLFYGPCAERIRQVFGVSLEQAR
jgi:hypothetical protein